MPAWDGVVRDGEYALLVEYVETLGRRAAENRNPHTEMSVERLPIMDTVIRLLYSLFVS
jgi:hypothetical protein